MALDANRHVEEEELELYSTSTMNEAQSAAVEEHLLVCANCRARLDEMDSFVRGVRAAGKKIRGTSGLRERVRAHPRVMLACAAGVAFTVGPLLVNRISVSPAETAPRPVTLEATRGAKGTAEAPAGASLMLEPDLSGLPVLDRYSLEMVDATGAAVWQGEMAAKSPRVIAAGQKGGLYFVRIFSPSRQLLREYGLRIGH
jgi:hypothetical protein